VLALALLTSAVAAACQPTLAGELELPAGTKQLVTVEAKVAKTTYAQLRTWRLSRGCWVAAAGPYPARLGKNGLSTSRREGDGTTPAGTFRIGGTMYGNEADPGVRFRYRRLRCGDWWDEDPASPTYNSFQHVSCGTKPPFAGESEGMWEQPRAYPFLAVIEYNTRPVVPGRGSGIFLHAQTAGPTIGCVSLRKDELRAVLRWLDPADKPMIAIGTSRQLRA
jgi:L,D-peptidoglycan transpeptidase YkuD (ErfK/YbiS/YcfS/YnhG family)